MQADVGRLLLTGAFVHPDHALSRRFWEEADLEVTTVTDDGFPVYGCEHYLRF